MTGQCATLTSAGSTPVACSARAFWRARMPAGRTNVRARVTRRGPTPSQLASVWIASPDARCERRHAPKARRELRDAYPSPIVVPSSRAFAPKNDRRAFLLPGSRAPGRLAYAARESRPGGRGRDAMPTSRARRARRSGVKARPHDHCRPYRRHGIEAQLAERPVVNRSVLVRIQPIPPQ